MFFQAPLLSVELLGWKLILQRNNNSAVFNVDHASVRTIGLMNNLSNVGIWRQQHTVSSAASCKQIKLLVLWFSAFKTPWSSVKHPWTWFGFLCDAQTLNLHVCMEKIAVNIRISGLRSVTGCVFCSLVVHLASLGRARWGRCSVEFHEPKKESALSNYMCCYRHERLYGPCFSASFLKGFL